MGTPCAFWRISAHLESTEHEELVRTFFANQGLTLQANLAVLVGASDVKKPHKFGLGSENPPVLVECKCHVWTEGHNSPSAKLKVWNEAMLYFSLAPPKYWKLLVVQRSVRASELLLEHYLRRYSHLIPPGVEVWEFDPVSAEGRCVYGGRTTSHLTPQRP